ncbi:hypothetical protein D3OALGA1CA_881 [Olavius algarvensis associated proteobacterium Delta 3]|nr:hypothetical protein D3OALGA1CA_881 [Olavius algarvensis associated proteobacterium Delta 3]CAB5143626.1 hypothetical protein D3OALGB2SA_4384 [Olavius algarvensis associated proteobacterium Delta 3]
MKQRAVSTAGIVLLLCMCFSNAHAAIFEITIDDVGNLEIAGVTIWFEISTDFAVTGPEGYGNAVPMNWWPDPTGISNISGTPLYTTGASDFDAVLGSPLVPLTSGTFYLLEYTGQIVDADPVTPEMDFYHVEFTDIDGNDLYQLRDMNLVSFTTTEAIFSVSQVPLPGSFVILCSGLLGVMVCWRLRATGCVKRGLLPEIGIC